MLRVESYPMNLERFKALARPALIFALGFCEILFAMCVCYILLVGKATLTEASAIIITFFSTSMPIIAAIVVGRSYEKGRGADGFFPGVQPYAPPAPVVVPPKGPTPVIATASVSTTTSTQTTTLPAPPSQNSGGVFNDGFK